MQGCLDGLFHLFFNTSALYTVTIPARFISAIAFFTSLGWRLWRMKIRHICNKIINRFGKAWLIRRANGKHELVGGSDGDYTEARNGFRSSPTTSFSAGQ
jgi:hypothetical protein